MLTSVTNSLDANSVAQGVPVRLFSVNASASSGIAAIRPTRVIAAEITAPARQTQRSKIANSISEFFSHLFRVFNPVCQECYQLILVCVLLIDCCHYSIHQNFILIYIANIISHTNQKYDNGNNHTPYRVIWIIKWSQ